MFYAGRDARANLFVLERLPNATERAFLPGCDRRVESRIGSNHDDYGIGIEFQKLFERAQAANTRHRHVKQHRVIGTLAVRIQSLLARLGEIYAIAFGREQRLEHVAHDLLVIDDEH